MGIIWAFRKTKKHNMFSTTATQIQINLLLLGLNSTILNNNKNTAMGGSKIWIKDQERREEEKRRREEELDEEEESGLPGFGVFAPLLALTLIVLTRRKD